MIVIHENYIYLMRTGYTKLHWKWNEHLLAFDTFILFLNGNENTFWKLYIPWKVNCPLSENEFGNPNPKQIIENKLKQRINSIGEICPVCAEI